MVGKLKGAALSNNPRPVVKSLALKRPTIDTRFYVDYEWWDKSNLDLRTYLFTRLPESSHATMDANVALVDLVDPQTAEVRQVDGFQYTIQRYFKQLPEDFTNRLSLVDAVFCVILANANHPISAREIAEQVKRPAEVVLKTIGGPTVYQGIRPILED